MAYRKMSSLNLVSLRKCHPRRLLKSSRRRQRKLREKLKLLQSW